MSVTLIACCSHNLIHCAATEDSPGALSSVGYYAGRLWNGLKNSVGQRGELYCLDETRGTPQLYHQVTTQTELALSLEHDDPAFKRLLASSDFRQSLEKCRKRAYYDWKHIQHNFWENKPRFAEELCRINIATLSPLLALTAQAYLEEEHFRQNETKKPMLFKLDSSQFGYLEWSLKSFKEFKKEKLEKNESKEEKPEKQEEYKISSKELEEIIDETQPKIVIDCTWEKVNRWVGKNIPTYTECLKYLTPEQEVKKSKAIYQNYIARLCLAARTGKTLGAKSKRNEIAALFQQPEFQHVYEQVWARHCALTTVLCTLLQPDPSIDVCRIYENHWKNISGLHAALIGDIILSKKQPQKEMLPIKFIKAHEKKEKPIDKFIYLFVSSLNNEQQDLLLEHKDHILKTIEESHSDEVAHNVYAYIKNASTNTNQRRLLEHIAEAKAITRIFELVQIKRNTNNESQSTPEATGQSAADALTSPLQSTPTSQETNSQTDESKKKKGETQPASPTPEQKTQPSPASSLQSVFQKYDLQSAKQKKTNRQSRRKK